MRDGAYNRKTREKLIADASGTLAPYFMSVEDSMSAQEQKTVALVVPFLHQHYLEHKNEWLEGWRELVRHLLKYRPGLIRNMPKFRFEIATISDDDISLIDRGNGRYSLNVLFNRASVEVEKGLLRGGGGLGISVDGFDCDGTREQLADLCLLRLRGEQSNARHFKEITKVLRVVTETEVKGNYQALREQRLKQGGFKNETDWLVHCMLSSCPELAREATGCARRVKDARVRDAACKIISDREVRPDVRAMAINLAGDYNGKTSLLALCNVLDDATPAYRKEYAAIFGEQYPFTAAKDTLLPLYEEIWQHGSDSKKTIGELAGARLKTATKKDFRNDREAWLKWVETKAR